MLNSNLIWNRVPKLCSKKKCPYRAFVFECFSSGYHSGRVTGYCLLHGKEAGTGIYNTSSIIFKSRKELENELLTISIIEG